MKKYLHLLLFTTFSSFLVYQLFCVKADQAPRKFPTVHGELTVQDPLALALIDHPNFQRLKGIEQHGLNTKGLKEASYTRFEHSLGVFALLKKHGATRKEQIAGLLHDASHTAFSHVGDYFFGHEDGKASWQDVDHENFLEQSGLAKIAKDHGITIEELDPKQPNYQRLEQDLPDLCADRNNYILHGALVLNLMSKERVKEIDDSLVFDEEKSTWYFSNLASAFDFSLASLWMTENSWGSPESFANTRWFVEAVRIGISKGFLNEKDFRWGTDKELWSKLKESKEPSILELLKKIENPKDYFKFEIASAPCEKPAIHQKFKLRIVDPFIKTSNGDFSRLSTLSEEYKKNYDQFKKKLNSGYCLTLY